MEGESELFAKFFDVLYSQQVASCYVYSENRIS